MKLVASMIVRNEIGRYLEPCIWHLLDFVDEVRVLDDHSTDGTYELLRAIGPGVTVRRSAGDGVMFGQEGKRRQELFDWTLEADPTHILAIDSDEFVTDGQGLRQNCGNSGVEVWTLEMAEVWKAFPACLCIRVDGGWRPHNAPILYQVPKTRPLSYEWKIGDQGLASGREPALVRRLCQLSRSHPSASGILHFGWANEDARAERHRRYVEADGGRFHQSAHLDSIMWADDQVWMDSRDWPAQLETQRPELVVLSGARE